MKTDKPGTNVQGQSSGINAYLNDEEFELEDTDLKLIKIDDNTRVVAGDEEYPVGVSLKKVFESNVLE